jgi:hypothetical protein
MKLLSVAFRVLGWLAICMGAVVVASAYYLYFFDGNPPAVLTVPYLTDSAQYHPGDPITVTAHVCKTNRYPVTTYAYLVKIPASKTSPEITGKLFPLPPISSVGTPAGCGTFTISGFYAVPKDVPPGRYTLRATNVFHVNAVADRSVDWYTNEFEVVP